MKLAIGRDEGWLFSCQVPENFSAQEIADFLANKIYSKTLFINQILVISVDENGNPIISRELLLGVDYI